MKVLVIGGGGREHAIVWKLKQSSGVTRLFCAPGNAGTAELADNVAIAADDVPKLVEFARNERVKLAVVGPEDALCAGIVDAMEKAGIRAFGPNKAAAQLEGDKAFAKRLMQQAGVPTADARLFGPSEAERRLRSLPAEGPDAPLLMEYERARAEGRDLRAAVASHLAKAGVTAAPAAVADEVRRLESLAAARLRESGVISAYEEARNYIATRDIGLVVKAAGLAKGKGAIVCNDPADALLALEQIMLDRVFGLAGETVVVEEKLAGPEASILAFVDGRNIYVMESAQDHKPVGEGDTGPNTGGMGAYSPTPVVTDDVLSLVERQVFIPTIDALTREGLTYKGVLYVGLMLTHNGPKVLEFNCRFGDPETQPILFRLQSDLLEAIDAVIDGRLDRITLRWDPRPAVCVVIASGGYPGDYVNGKEITGLADAAFSPDVCVFHAGTRRVGDKVLTAGGRVLGVTARADTLADAQKLAYQAVDRIRFDGAYCRRDIGFRALDAGHRG